VIEVRPPSASEERWFGFIPLVFFSIVAALVLWQTGAVRIAAAALLLGAAIAAVYYASPACRRPLYFAWMRLVSPIGWVVSNVALALVYFLIVTPLGLAMRTMRRDPLRLRRRPHASTHWVARAQSDDPARYLRQS
jgi:hypothetical protein